MLEKALNVNKATVLAGVVKLIRLKVEFAQMSISNLN